MIEEAIQTASAGNDLSKEQAKQAFDEIMSGAVEKEQIKQLLIALRDKGETVEEISGAAESMRAVVAAVKPNVDRPLLDVVGTGGDNKGTINVSTCSAIVAAGVGCLVAKHGNRSVSSKCGSADVLEALGVKIDTPAEKNAELIEKIGIAFLFAPVHHPAMKYAMPARKEIGARTIFNILGPITNPASAQTYLLGVFNLELAEKLANVLASLKTEHALVVHGVDGFDEISASNPTTVFEVRQGSVEKSEISPEQFGFESAAEEEVKADTVEENASILRAILSGEENGAKRNIILLNAGAAIYANNQAESIAQGIEKAKQSIESGAALKKLALLVKGSNK